MMTRASPHGLVQLRFMMGDIEIGSTSEAAEHGLANTPNCLLLPVPTTGGLCASLPWFSSCFCMRNKSEVQLRDVYETQLSAIKSTSYTAWFVLPVSGEMCLEALLHFSNVAAPMLR